MLSDGQRARPAGQFQTGPILTARADRIDLSYGIGMILTPLSHPEQSSESVAPRATASFPRGPVATLAADGCSSAMH